MIKKSKFKAVLLPFFLIACSVSNPNQDSKLPISCPDFSELKVSVSNTADSEVAISFENPFSLDSVLEQGLLVYHNVRNSELDLKDAFHSITPKLDTTIVNDLICGLHYETKAYAKIEYKNDQVYCFTQPTSFLSEGSENVVPWCANRYQKDIGFDFPIGLKIQENLYYLYQNGSFYSFNPETKNRIKLNDFPYRGNTGTYYTSFSIENVGYYISSPNGFPNAFSEIFIYTPDNNSWDSLAISESFVLEKELESTFAEELDGLGYYFNKRITGYYDPKSNTSTVLFESTEPLDFIDSFKSNNAIYAINSNFEVLKLNISTNSWDLVSVYQGKKATDIISFNHDNLAYMGFSYTSDGFVNNDIWSLNLLTLEWKELNPFPLELSPIVPWGLSGLSSDSAFFVYFDGRTVIDGSSNISTLIWEISPDELDP